MDRIRIRVRIGFSVWSVSCYAHVFVLIRVVVVTLPSCCTLFQAAVNNWTELVAKPFQLPLLWAAITVDSFSVSSTEDLSASVIFLLLALSVYLEVFFIAYVCVFVRWWLTT